MPALQRAASASTTSRQTGERGIIFADHALASSIPVRFPEKVHLLCKYTEGVACRKILITENEK
jgi:hypothetical protein